MFRYSGPNKCYLVCSAGKGISTISKDSSSGNALFSPSFLDPIVKERYDRFVS